LKIAGRSVVLSGLVKGNTEIMAEQVSARPGAKIEGNLTYYGNSNLKIDKSIVAGEIIRKSLPAKNRGDGFLGAELAGFLSILVLAYVFFKLFPKKARDIFVSLLERDSWKMIAAGLLAIILIPITAIILMITVIGMPLAIILIFVFISAVLFAKAIASIVLGFAINRHFKPREFTDSFPLTDFVLGYLILELLMLIPFLGPLAAFLIFLWAFGGIVKYFYGGLKKKEVTP